MTGRQTWYARAKDRLIIVMGFGAVTVAVSEYLFYEVAEDVDSLAILLAYGLLSYLFVVLNHRFNITDLPGFIVATALLGVLIEGVAVPVVYAGPPLTIVWTSLAWHALITVGVGLVWVRRVLSGASFGGAAMFCVCFGLCLGVWNGFMWHAKEISDQDGFAFDWTPIGPFVWQCLFGYVLFLGGHLLLDRAYPRSARFGRAEHVGLWAVALVFSALTATGSGLLMLYPILPGLIAICLFALWTHQRKEADMGRRYLDQLFTHQIPLERWALSSLVPVGAIVAYAAYVAAQIELEMNVVVILTAGPISTGLFVWALYRALAVRSRG